MTAQGPAEKKPMVSKREPCLSTFFGLITNRSGIVFSVSPEAFCDKVLSVGCLPTDRRRGRHSGYGGCWRFCPQVWSTAKKPIGKTFLILLRPNCSEMNGGAEEDRTPDLLTASGVRAKDSDPFSFYGLEPDPAPIQGFPTLQQLQELWLAESISSKFDGKSDTRTTQ